MSRMTELKGRTERLVLAVGLFYFGLQGAKADQPFSVVEKQGMPFVAIPAGQFLMGTSEANREELMKQGWWTRFLVDEQPVRQVAVTRPFLMGVTEVTQAQWKRIMEKEHGSVSFKGADRPVDSVSFTDVSKFLQRLNQRASGGQFRLPTEAEWEYTCRAGDWGLYFVGSNGKQVDHTGISAYAWTKESSEIGTARVGLKRANAWGLKDMLGNVWELCADYYDRTQYASTSNPIYDPLNQSVFSERVMRGGSWFLPTRYSRSAARSGIPERDRSPYVGFRLVFEGNEISGQEDDGKSISK